MVNVVIAGGGDLGRHIAAILSGERHNVILIDKDPKVLEEISGKIDIGTRQGSATDWQLLDDLLEFSPDIFIALTGEDEINLVSCTIAKQLRYPRAIARINHERYLNRSRLDFARIFGIDYFVGPELLVAQDIVKQITTPGSIAVESFAHGALQLRTIKIPEEWRSSSVELKDLNLPKNIIVGLIRREIAAKDADEGTSWQLIFPHGRDTILPGDEVTFIGETEDISRIHNFFYIKQKEVKSIVIVGGSLTGIYLARLLEPYHIDIRIIEKEFERCKKLAELLPHATIMNHDATDLDFLSIEKIGRADIFVACTNHDEVNLFASLLSKEVGCESAVVILSNTAYIPIAAWLGFRYTASPRVSATNQILSQLFSGKITSLISIYENQAEIMEINVSMNSKVVGIPLSELGPYLPQDLLIVMIQNRGKITIAHGDRIISPGDTVIVVTSPKHVKELEKIF